MADSVSVSDTNPAEVYAIWDRKESIEDVTDVDAVTKGFFKYKLLETNRNPRDTRNIAVKIVLTIGSQDSEKPITLTYGEEGSAELDAYGPDLDVVYVNKARNKLFLYFDEQLEGDVEIDVASIKINISTDGKYLSVDIPKLLREGERFGFGDLEINYGESEDTATLVINFSLN